MAHISLKVVEMAIYLKEGKNWADLTATVVHQAIFVRWGVPRLMMWDRSIALRHQYDAYMYMQCSAMHHNKKDNVTQSTTFSSCFAKKKTAKIIQTSTALLPLFSLQNNAQLSFCEGCQVPNCVIKQNKTNVLNIFNLWEKIATVIFLIWQFV